MKIRISLNTTDSQKIALNNLLRELAKIDNPAQVAQWVKEQGEAGELPRPSEDFDVILYCLEMRQFASIPHLHQAGWRLRDDPKSWKLMANDLSIGDWPHPELITPDCMAQDAFFDGIGRLLIVNMFFHPNKPWVPHLQRLDNLDRDRRLVGRMSEHLGMMADMSQIDDLPYDCLDDCVDFMLVRGWVEPGAVLEAGRAKLHSEEFCQWFTGAAARHIDLGGQQVIRSGRVARL